MNTPVPQVFPIQVLSLGCLLGALVLAVVITPADEAGILGTATGTWSYGWHALALAGGIGGLVSGRRWTVPVVAAGAAGALLTVHAPTIDMAALLGWVLYGLLVMGHLEFRDGAARVLTWARGAGAELDVAHVVRSYLRRALMAFIATGALCLAALTFATWARPMLPPAVAHGIELEGAYGLLLGAGLVLPATFVAAWAVQAALSRRPAAATAPQEVPA